MFSFSRRVLPVLQLTRMALVFTAIADSNTGLLIGASSHAAGNGGDIADYLDPWRIVALFLMSTGLYGFGMSLNDIIDRRRDSLMAAHRPLPSGRIGVGTAHLICAALGLLALLAGAYCAFSAPHPIGGWMSLVLVIWTGLLIAFYDFAGKYLVAPGLLSLGLIRFFHSVIAAPQMPLLWHPLFLLNHVAILSTVAYHWEHKRPRLTRGHWTYVFGGLVFIDVMAVLLIDWRRRGWPFGPVSPLRSLWITPGLLLPVAAAVVFVVVAGVIKYRSKSSREAGQRVVLFGLLWLIVYDAAFCAGYVSTLAGVCVFMLMPVAWLMVQFMRWWSTILTLSQRPAFKRAESS